MASVLQGFEEVRLVNPVGKITMTVTANPVRFNKGTAQAMGFPAFVRLLVDGNGRRIGVAVTTGEALNAVKFSKTEEKQTASVSVREQAALDAIGKFFTLAEAPEGEVAYVSVPGTYYPDDKAVIFNVNDATAGTMKRRGRKKATGSAESDKSAE